MVTSFKRQKSDIQPVSNETGHEREPQNGKSSKMEKISAKFRGVKAEKTLHKTKNRKKEKFLAFRKT